MASHIPFVSGSADCQSALEHYGDSEVLRVCLCDLPDLAGQLPDNCPLWVDCGVDALQHSRDSMAGGWRSFVEGIEGGGDLLEAGLTAAVPTVAVERFVNCALDAAMTYFPEWLSVPQVPVVAGAERNLLNRRLADAAGDWRRASQFSGRFVLPVIVADASALDRQAGRSAKTRAACSCYERSSADGIWLVNCALDDETGYRPNQADRFPGLVAWHKEVLQTLGADTPCVAGPYWGMNLVLWARGLASHAAIGVGRGYQYHVPGGPMRRGVSRVALPPLRRRAIVCPGLRSWLSAAAERLSEYGVESTDLSQTEAWLGNAISELGGLGADFGRLGVGQVSRGQVAAFYKRWYESIAQVSSGVRAFALYQDFSFAHILGKALDALPKGAGRPRQPDRLAQQFMLSCL